MATVEQKRLKKILQDGSYFEEAKSWYKAIYLQPIADRSLYLFFSLVLVFSALFCLLGVKLLLPLKDAYPILLPMSDIDTKVVRMSPLRKPGSTADEALLNYFLGVYVVMRESYDPQTYAMARSFVALHTHKDQLHVYDAMHHPDNLRNPARILGQAGRRIVEVQSLQLSPSEGKATVRFGTELRGVGGNTKTEWTATIDYVYSDLLIQGIVNEQTGVLTTETYAPQFQVLRYDVQPIH